MLKREIMPPCAPEKDLVLPEAHSFLLLREKRSGGREVRCYHIRLRNFFPFGCARDGAVLMGSLHQVGLQLLEPARELGRKPADSRRKRRRKSCFARIRPLDIMKPGLAEMSPATILDTLLH